MVLKGLELEGVAFLQALKGAWGWGWETPLRPESGLCQRRDGLAMGRLTGKCPPPPSSTQWLRLIFL